MKVEKDHRLGFIASACLDSAIARPDIRREGAYETAGVFTPVKEMLSESAGDGKVDLLLCWHRSRFSTRKTG